MWIDSHTHLQDARLACQQDAWLPQLLRLPIQRAVVNGTSESDWQKVAELAQQHPWVLPSFGLHPWQVGHQTDSWLDSLARFLHSHPHAGVGEIGLDRWIQPHDFPAQIRAFKSQLDLATSFQRPVTIHCLRAWGNLRDILATSQLPTQGFLLHAYGGPHELIAEFESLGAYFSFSPSFLHPAKYRKRDLFLKMSADRILVETDAPDMAPPPECNAFPLRSGEGKLINHPCNLEVAYTGLATLLNLTPEDLKQRVQTNFSRLFGS
jgi:TatD DNase family protein